MSRNNQRNSSMLRLALLAVFLLLGVGQALGFCHSGNAHIKCCAKQQAQYKRNGDLKRLICERCDSGYEPTDNKEQCISKVGSACKRGYGPTPGYFQGKQKCVKCSDKNCKDCSSIFYDCNVCKKGYSSVGGDCTKLVY
mmetsp:Transcript_7484/g.20431  ORF Transcript_7484/g.20431 Transcript_7484/m.20431 type:complete len:139 (-) Transcript_7484:109-525(-)